MASSTPLMEVCGLNVTTHNPIELDMLGAIRNVESDSKGPPDVLTFNGSFAIPGVLNLGWICATINSLSTILYCFVYFKMCHIMFTKHKSRNWLTISIYLLIMLDLLVGCTATTSVVLENNVYQTTTRASVSNLSIVLLSLQKGLYSVIVLTQIFEWAMLTMFLWF
jgi:hypothetical protein